MTISRTLCQLFGHKDPAAGRWNGSYCFGNCRRCGVDLVRTAKSGWHVPRGYRVVWRPAPEAEVEPVAPDLMDWPEPEDEAPLEWAQLQERIPPTQAASPLPPYDGSEDTQRAEWPLIAAPAKPHISEPEQVTAAERELAVEEVPEPSPEPLPEPEAQPQAAPAADFMDEGVDDGWDDLAPFPGQMPASAGSR